MSAVKHRVMHVDARVFERFAPTRDLVREIGAAENVLFCSPSDPANAELAGRGFAVAHYDVELERDRIAADSDVSGQTWRRMFQRAHVRFAIVSLIEPPNPALKAALSDARLVRAIAQRELWQLPPQDEPAEDLVRVRDAARNRFWP